MKILLNESDIPDDIILYYARFVKSKSCPDFDIIVRHYEVISDDRSIYGVADRDKMTIEFKTDNTTEYMDDVEWLIWILAHEIRHIWQKGKNIQWPERDANQWADRMIKKYRRRLKWKKNL